MTARDWAAAGTGLFLERLDSLSDADLAEPTALAGWTRAHLVAHVHFNACALGRLVSWAASGAESRMYSSASQRAAEIGEGACWAPARLRAAVRTSATDLGRAMDALGPEAWAASVITAQGRTVPAAEIPWLRAREVMVHAVDLGAGLTFGDLPPEFLVALLRDVVAKRASAGEGPGLAAYLTGRAPSPPALTRWL